jgi:hypothetical protein
MLAKKFMRLPCNANSQKTIKMYLSSVNFKEHRLTPYYRLWFANFLLEFGFVLETLTHVCVHKVRIIGQVTLVILQTGSLAATTKIPDLYAVFL